MKLTFFQLGFRLWTYMASKYVYIHVPLSDTYMYYRIASQGLVSCSVDRISDYCDQSQAKQHLFALEISEKHFFANRSFTTSMYFMIYVYVERKNHWWLIIMGFMAIQDYFTQSLFGRWAKFSTRINTLTATCRNKSACFS